MNEVQEVKGLQDYQTKVAHDAPKGHKAVSVKARKLEGTESFKCPATRRISTGTKGDYIVVLPSGKRPNTLAKSAKGEKVADIVVHGKRFVVSETVFKATYVTTKEEKPKAEKEAKPKKDAETKAKPEKKANSGK